MKTFIAFLTLALNLVSANEISLAESRQMNISETQKCYVYGQCQEYSLDFKVTQDAEGCHKFCGKNEECNWWSWEPAFELCMLFANCTEVGIDPPAVEPCPECISGEKGCPARECHGAFKCKGVFVDSFAIGTLEECIEKCNDMEDCQWFTLEKANDHCILYEECNDQFDCETCATGEKKCAHGYKGTTVDPPAESGGWVLNVNWTHSYYYLVRDTQMIFGEGGPGAGKPKADCINPGLNGNEWKCERLWEKYHGVVPSPPYCGSQPIICNTAWHEVGWDKAVTPTDVWSNSGLGMEACAAITEYPDTFKACESAYWAYDG